MLSFRSTSSTWISIGVDWGGAKIASMKAVTKIRTQSTGDEVRLRDR